MPPLPTWLWPALAAVLGLLLAWLGWRWGPGARLRALEAEVFRLGGLVRRGWGDDDLKTQHVRGMLGKRTTLDVRKKGPF